MLRKLLLSGKSLPRRQVIALNVPLHPRPSNDKESVPEPKQLGASMKFKQSQDIVTLTFSNDFILAQVW